MLPEDFDHPPFSARPILHPEAKFPSPLNYTSRPPGRAEPAAGQGTFRLFRVLGITVFLHWSWFVVALIQIQRMRVYTSILWSVAEYLTLFAIVLMHEFGHALACRSVGGRAERIVLWPLGGIAFVDPPARPGAMLWSIAAGPLVNVVLFPLTYLLYAQTQVAAGNFAHFTEAILWLNGGLLVFNMLPIYPLDGGQIFQSLLWFVLGYARSLLIAAWVGVVGAAGLLILAAYWQSIWIAVLAVFAGSMAWRGVTQARMMMRMRR